MTFDHKLLPRFRWSPQVRTIFAMGAGGSPPCGNPTGARTVGEGLNLLPALAASPGSGQQRMKRTLGIYGY